MARTVAELPKGTRVTDFVSLGVLARFFPREQIWRVLNECNRQSKRQRDLPAHVVMYYVILLPLYMQASCQEVLRCLYEGVRWLFGNDSVRIAGKSGISQARSRLGVEPVKRLHDGLVHPVAKKSTRGAWYAGLRLVSLDGSTLEVADTQENRERFGLPPASRGRSAYPQLRYISLAEIGTHVLFGSTLGPYSEGETTLARKALHSLGRGMLCLADRHFLGFDLWQQARSTSAHLLWRAKRNVILPCLRRLADGSYLSRIYPSVKDRRNDTNGVTVRVIEYALDGVADAEPLYRLVTSLLDPRKAPASQLAALYHERWEIETAFDELKTHLKGARVVLRSKRPDLVEQEFYGLMMAHFALRGLMHEAARENQEDPDQLSYVHAVRVVRRKLGLINAFSPEAEETAPS